MIWTVLKALFTLIPFIVEMIREGRIKTGAYDEIERAIGASWNSRVAAAIAAKEGELPDEADDVHNRSRGTDQLSVG